MSINRPDRPLRSQGAEHRRRDHDHPDRKADLQERSDGAHVEFVTPPQAEPGQMSADDEDASMTSRTSADIPQRHDAPPESPAGTRGPGAGDGPTSSPESEVEGDPGSRSRSPRFAIAAAFVIVLLIPALIYLAMIAGVFTVGG